MDRVVLLADHFESYRKAKLRGASPGTINQYHVTLRGFDRYLERPAYGHDLTNETVADFVWSMLDRGRSPATANKARANLLAIWRWLCRRGVLREWPDVDKLREPERIPIAWTRDELQRLWRMCEGQPGKIAGVPASLWWHGLHAVIWDSGERVTAVRSTPRDAVSFDAGTIVFRAETRKGRTRDRVHRLHPQTLSLLRQMWLPERADLFPWPFHFCYLWIKYRFMLRKAGLPADRAHKFHCLRRSVASYFEAAGGNATALLDHSSRELTVKHYLDLRITGTAQSACDVLFRPGETG